MKAFFKRNVLGVAVIALALWGLAFLFFKPSPKADAFDNPQRFRIESGGNAVGVALVTDRETGVQYLLNTHSGSFTVLVDKDGRPYLANGWRDYE